MSTNLFDLRTVLLAKHAQHVVLIHFPIALFLSGVAFDLIARTRNTSIFTAAATVNLTAAAITVVPALITGGLAWRFALDAQRIHGVLLFHIAAALLSSALVIACWWLRRASRSIFVLVLELAGVI